MKKKTTYSLKPCGVTIKIIILLFVMITAVGYLRTYLHPDRVKVWLAKSEA
ncbi:MAG: hypothetical protein AABY09_02715 [Nanoarchaeota archaeon]